MAELVSLFSLPFMVRALVAGLSLGALLSFIGVFVVLRRMSFFGDGIAHASLAGVAIGVLAGINPFWIALAAGVVFALIIYLLEHKTKLASDAIIGVIFTAGLALGVVLLSLERGFQPDLISFLFGNILAITSSDVLFITIFSAALLLFLAFVLNNLALLTIDRDAAWLKGVPVTTLEIVFYVALAISIVLGVKLLGIILVSALLITPPTIAKLIASSFKGMLLVSVAAGEVSVVLGLITSYYLDLPSGATIILAATALFLLALIANALFKRGA